jgi:hypothetical protein
MDQDIPYHPFLFNINVELQCPPWELTKDLVFIIYNIINFIYYKIKAFFMWNSGCFLNIFLIQLFGRKLHSNNPFLFMFQTFFFNKKNWIEKKI